ncbi:penicillin-binding protein 2 [Pararhizobium sp. IMCC21322]|uniref:peptidoglycan D,D-transpeptidase FtsI family protein n=1 Tax=Pararhizobium sp. IMCC21322 TaxID=3067903 RepID=UPI00274119D6|nr:penicillin-binding protein 2 [Pararhizobium sp. IMCC21322]
MAISDTFDAAKAKVSLQTSVQRHVSFKDTAAVQKDDSRMRLLMAVGLFAVIYAVIGLRLAGIAMFGELDAGNPYGSSGVSAARPDLLDRNGEVLATDVKTFSMFAEPRRVLDADEVVDGLATIFPDLDSDAVRKRMASDRGFMWLKREITQEQQRAIHRMGLAGVDFLNENRRFYPGRETASHILGHVNIDNEGIAGIEKHIDGQGLSDLQEAGLQMERNLEPMRLSTDLRVQHVVRDELTKAMERYKAIAAIGIVLDVNTGEVIAMSSQPDYDPNIPAQALEKERMNRATAGVFEMGSIFKTFTTAMALDSGKVAINDNFDARRPIRVSRYTINDFHGKNRVLSVPEVYIYSSNIGTAKMALEVGIDGHKEFLSRLGLMDRLRTELPESADPQYPSKWSQISAMTISFGHGISVSPMQTAVAAAALVNGGKLIPPTFFPRSKAEADQLAKRVVSQETSDKMRYLMRLNVLKGSGRRAEVQGYRLGGKTGTAEKVIDGKYSSTVRFNSFLAAFPMDDPKYLVLVVIDEPKPEKEGIGATAGRNAAPTLAAIVKRAAPMLGVMPRMENDAALGIPQYDVPSPAR